MSDRLQTEKNASEYEYNCSELIALKESSQRTFKIKLLYLNLKGTCRFIVLTAVQFLDQA